MISYCFLNNKLTQEQEFCSKEGQSYLITQFLHIMYFQQVLFQSWLDKKLDIHYLTNEYIISMIAISVYCVPFTSPLGTAPRSNNISSWIKSMFKNKVKEQILILNSPVSWSNFNYIMVLICTIFLATTYTLKSNKIEIQWWPTGPLAV